MHLNRRHETISYRIVIHGSVATLKVCYPAKKENQTKREVFAGRHCESLK